MNYTRLALTTIVATVVDALYGSLIYGMALDGEIAPYRDVYRSVAAVNANLPWLVAGLLLAMGAASYIYARSCGRGGILEGLRFGVVMGLFSVGYIAIGNYVVMRVSRRLTVVMAMAGLVEWIVVGLAIGLVYQWTDRSHGLSK